jgi:hypothetical protein
MLQLKDLYTNARASRTEEGYFVGVQHPMVLILRKHDMKLISCSRKKVIVYEALYTLPLSLSSSQLESHLHQDAKGNKGQLVDDVVDGLESVREDQTTPSHVQSIKSVSAHIIPPPNTTGTNKFRARSVLDDAAETQSAKSGEGLVVPEHVEYASDLQKGISMMKMKRSWKLKILASDKRLCLPLSKQKTQCKKL